MSNTTRLTQERLQELLSYDSKTGQFRWRQTRCQTAKKGQVAGSISGEGHRQVMLDKVFHSEARLAWLYAKGTLPPSPVFHLDRNPANNAIANLSLTAPPQRRKARAHDQLSQERLKELVTYDPAEGTFTWRVDRNNHTLAGSRAGFVHPYKGTRWIRLDCRSYSAARLAFLYQNGSFPAGRLYRVGAKDDDAWANITTVKPMPSGKPRKKVAKKKTQGLLKAIALSGSSAGKKKAAKIQQDAKDAAAWDELCGESAEPFEAMSAPKVMTQEQYDFLCDAGGVDCIVPPAEAVTPQTVGRLALFNTISERLWAVLK